jgi:hypothetical protein
MIRNFSEFVFLLPKIIFVLVRKHAVHVNFGITEWRTKREREREKISFRWEIERYIILEFVVEYFF